MNEVEVDTRRSLRWSVYAVLIALAVGDMSGRLFAVNSVNRADLEKSVIQRRLNRRRDQFEARGFAPEELERRLEAERLAAESEERRQRPFLSANDRSRWLAIRALV